VNTYAAVFQFAVLAAMTVAGVAYLAWINPVAEPSLDGRCWGGDGAGDGCVSRVAVPRVTDFHGITDPAVERFLRIVLPLSGMLWFALSPFGYLSVKLVRWLADRLHRARHRA
jgi:hypothetical protein